MIAAASASPRFKIIYQKLVRAISLGAFPLEGEISSLIREGVRRRLAVYERQFRDDEPPKRMKDTAARACRGLYRARVLEEMRRRKGTSTAEHLKIVLSVIDDWARSQLNHD